MHASKGTWIALSKKTLTIIKFCHRRSSDGITTYFVTIRGGARWTLRSAFIELSCSQNAAGLAQQSREHTCTIGPQTSTTVKYKYKRRVVESSMGEIIL